MEIQFRFQLYKLSLLLVIKSYNPLEEIAKKYCKEVYVIGGAKQAGGAIPATKEGLEVGLKKL